MSQNKKIKNVIFDFGGVIFDIDFSLCNKSFMKLGIENIESRYLQAQEKNLFNELEKGKITSKNFCEKIRKLSNVFIKDEEIINAWNSLLVGYKKDRLELLENIKLFYRTFLLSNTNKIHYDAYLQMLKDNHGYNGLSTLFEETYFSHQIGMRKPEREIFEFVLNGKKLIPEETVFIDDNKLNIEAARKLGIVAYFLDVENGEQLTDLFDNNFKLKIA